ncbi:MAG: IS3 family transposase [Deltaproteobacteria bacterium]|nr:IS3 family transposase [Deltaproteobacteria bacterium]
MSKEVGMSRKNRSKGGSPSRTQGARRATGERDGGGALSPGQRWSAGRKREVVLRILRGESLDALSRELGVEIYRLEQWRDQALSGMDLGLKDRQDDPLSRELDAAKRHIGELSMEVELLRERSRAAEGKLPLATRRLRR